MSCSRARLGDREPHSSFGESRSPIGGPRDRHPLVDAIGPTGRLIARREPYALDSAGARCALETGTFLDVNANRMPRLKRSTPGGAEGRGQC